jgi:hypothetical protein
VEVLAAFLEVVLVVLVEVAQAVKPLPALLGLLVQPAQAAVAVGGRIPTAVLAAPASSSSVTHSVWHKDFK